MRIVSLFLLIYVLPTHDTFAQKKSKENNTGKNWGTVELLIEPTVGDKVFYFDSTYENGKGELYNLKTLRFFLSHLALSRSTGLESSALTEGTTGVFLIDFAQADSSMKGNACKFVFQVEEGQYSDLRMDVGVPRNLNHADPSAAAYPLDLGRGDMYWEWNSGYIFFLAEGYGADVYKNQFHFAIGNDTRIMPLHFGNLFNVVPLIRIEKNKMTRIRLRFDFNKVMSLGDGSFYTLNTPASAVVHGGYHADVLRNNILNAFEFLSAELVK